MENTIDLAPIKSGQLPNSSAIDHGFFTRTGGVSTGLYKGLNVGIGSDDCREDVMENRALVARHFNLPNENLVTVYQIHSPNALTVNQPISGVRPQADAIISNTPGLIAGILTADCGPVLFADETAGVIAAAHAGWQGATTGVLENTVAKMQTLGATKANLKAVLGPTISQNNYEVGPEFVDRLIALNSDNSRWIKPSKKPDHGLFDLPGYIVNRLNQMGVSASWTGHCTYDGAQKEKGLFYSYRRKTHLDEPDYGRQLSAICIK